VWSDPRRPPVHLVATLFSQTDNETGTNKTVHKIVIYVNKVGLLSADYKVFL
jgi:hypothetical protein